MSSLCSQELIGARLSSTSPNGKWNIALWGRNLTDEEYIVDSTDLEGNFGFISEFYGDRRSVGIDLSHTF